MHPPCCLRQGALLLLLAGVGVSLLGACKPVRGQEKAREEKRGHLELRVLANEHDELKALEAASQFFDEVKKDAERRADLQRRARKGLPPPPVKVATDWAPSYSWVEIGPSELRTLDLDKEPEKETPAADRWQRVAEARAKGEPIGFRRTVVPDEDVELLYSRPCQDPKLSVEERQRKRYDYFLLTRDPEQGKVITGEYLAEVKAGEDLRGAPCINSKFNKKGGELFYELTSKNRRRAEEIRRHLAIIVDGHIVTAPVINEPIHEKVQLSGGFTRKDVERLLTIRQDLEKNKK